MSDYITIRINSRCTLYLTSGELSSLLARDPELYARAIGRGKHFERLRKEYDR